jgi:hypothetical protein
MSPPAPEQTYKDSYPNNADHEDPRIRDNIAKRENYEAEVRVYRALERLEERLIVLHNFKFTHNQYALCDKNHDRRKCPHCRKSKNSEECDFLVIGEDFFIVIEVKNTRTDGGIAEAFKESKKQRDRVKSLIQAINPEARVLKFTAFPAIPSLSSLTYDQLIRIDGTVILQNNLDDLSTWWQNNVSSGIPGMSSFADKERKYSDFEHDRVKYLLLAISCTEEDVPDDSRFSLPKTVVRIDKELKEAEITLEQQFKDSHSKETESINPGVVKAPDFVTKHLGVKFLTTEQNKALRLIEKQLIIIGPAGAGKTMLLTAKLLELAKSGSGRKIIVYTFSGSGNTSTAFQDACDSASVEYEVLRIQWATEPASNLALFRQMMEILNYCRVVIIQIIMPATYSSPIKSSIETNLGTIKLLNDCDILVDDIQSMLSIHPTTSGDGLMGFLKFQKELPKCCTFIVTYDLMQHYWTDAIDNKLAVKDFDSKTTLVSMLLSVLGLILGMGVVLGFISITAFTMWLLGELGLAAMSARFLHTKSGFGLRHALELAAAFVLVTILGMFMGLYYFKWSEDLKRWYVLAVGIIILGFRFLFPVIRFVQARRWKKDVGMNIREIFHEHYCVIKEFAEYIRNFQKFICYKMQVCGIQYFWDVITESRGGTLYSWPDNGDACF